MTKMKNYFLHFLYLILVILIASQLFLIYKINSSNNFSQLKNNHPLKTESVDKDDLPSHDSYFSNRDYYEEAFSLNKEQEFNTGKKVYGGILPHHLIVKKKIAVFLNSLKGSGYEHIVLIGPNHFLKGGTAITSQAKWQTPYGNLLPDLELIEKLSEQEEVVVNEDPFKIEHSISGLVAFIKKTFPEAKFTPLVLRPSVDPELCANLADVIIENNQKEKTLVLASVDFSHYQPVKVADFHDMLSQSVIESFKKDRVYDLELDSPPSIYLLLDYLEKINSQDSKLIFHTNSGRLLNDYDIETTSHNFYYFFSGEAKQKFSENFLFFGDLMLDRGVNELIERRGLDYIFKGLAGRENLFFKGVDIISANLEGAVTNNGEHYNPDNLYDFAFKPSVVNSLKRYNFNFFNLANNHFYDQGHKGVEESYENLENSNFYFSGCPDSQIGECSWLVIEKDGKKIALAGFSMVHSSLNQEKLKNEIERLKNKVDIIIVNMHWGVEYEHQFNKIQQKIAHLLIDSGVDVIIGHHPHVVQGMEIYKNKPIFYSLGNFIFDQNFSDDTQEGLSLGINWSDRGLDISLFPFKANQGSIDLMARDDKKDFLKRFISWSSISANIEDQLLLGDIDNF